VFISCPKRHWLISNSEKSGEKPEIDEDNYEEADKATMKARAWDEFTEENPK
jgi:immunoglobulin-binding protein 1